MPAPDTIDLSGGGGPWPAFTLSGVTGASAADMNGRWNLDPTLGYVHVTSGGQCQEDEGVWTIENGSDQFEGTGTWPWTVESWTAVGTHAGTLAFAHALAEPDTLDLSSGGAAVAATLTTSLTGSNNDLVFTAVLSGRLGNDIRVRYVDPAANGAALSVAVSGRDITVNLATDGSGTITSTAALVEAAIEASTAAAALVTVANAAANDGTGIVTALAYTALSGGTGGLPLPPDTISL